MASSPNRSKKQSVGNSARPPSPPEDFVLYLDENLHNCKPILQALAHNGIHHQRHGQHFPAGTEDSLWLPFVGEKGWILLTKDKRIRFNDLEKQAVIANRVREFYFTSGNINGEEMAGLLVVALPEMIRLSRKHPPPFIASLTRAGNVHIRLQAKEDLN